MATQPRHLHGLLAFLDPLLRRTPPSHRPAIRLQIRDDESYAREQPWIRFLTPDREGVVSHLGAFAAPGDSAMLESCPFRLPANREGIRLKRCPLGSNAQVSPARVAGCAHSRATRHRCASGSPGSSVLLN